jgi:signal transduction histidine kinase
MRERALLVGGDLTIESRPGQGTTVRLSVPG